MKKLLKILNNERDIELIIPCKNEELYLGGFLSSILSQSILFKVKTIFIADGLSKDKSIDVIKDFERSFQEKGIEIKVLLNHMEDTPSGLNLCLRFTSARYIARLDVHSNYNLDYLERLYIGLRSTDFDCVGGAWIISPARESPVAQSIARASSSIFAVGNVPYKQIAVRDSFEEVENVPYGFYKMSIFEKIGYFDTDLKRNQDNEFYSRMKKYGLKIGLNSAIQITYFARATFISLFKNYYGYGLYTPIFDFKVRQLSIRRSIPIIFFVLLFMTALFSIYVPIIIFSIYILTITFASLFREKLRLIETIFFIYSHIVIHISFAIGYFVGILKLVEFILRKSNKIIKS
jgi:glycosyltransferase involved in cell wall biosynthesis